MHPTPNALENALAHAAKSRDTVAFAVSGETCGAASGAVYVAEGALTAVHLVGQMELPEFFAAAGFADAATELRTCADSWWTWQHLLADDGLVQLLRGLTVYNVDRLLDAHDIDVCEAPLDPLTTPYAMNLALRHDIEQVLSRRRIGTVIDHLLGDRATLVGAGH
jgi:hypothetical protein